MDKTRNYSALIRQLLFVGLLITISIILFINLKFFVGAFLGALTLYIVLRGTLFKMTDEKGFKGWVASTILVTGATIILLALGYLVFEVIASEIPDVDTSKITEGLETLPQQINDFVGYKVISDNILGAESRQYITKFASSILNSTYSFAINIFMMLIILYFMLANGRRMERVILMYTPFSGRSLQLLECEIHNVVFSNAVGIPIIMLAQGITAAIIYWLMGLSNVIFWAFLTAICGLIPLIGTSLVTVPIGIYFIANGDFIKGIIMILCGLLVIANADNLTRIILMKKVANTHPLIVIFGVIIGIPMFGFWGIIFGPLFISMFILLVRIYYVEYQLFNCENLSEVRDPDRFLKTGK